MTFSQTPEGDAASVPVIACLEPHCQRPVVSPAVRCRIHLAEAMRRTGW